MIGIANAPVSIGVFELAGSAPAPDPDLVLERFAADGYEGIDLGPIGYLGTGQELDARLERVGFGLAGGWIDLPFSDDDAFRAALPAYRDALAVFREVRRPADRPAPRPTLACSGRPERAAHPGGGAEVRLSPAGWDRLVANLGSAVAIARDEGLEPTFHHHACTDVETVDEIEELLERSDVDLTFDTGHLLLGGGDPVADLRRWVGRVNHVHIKDARIDVLQRVVAAGGGLREVWEAGAFVALGQGDLDLAGTMEVLLESGYAGWVVVEQDSLPGPDRDAAAMLDDQRTNREVLRRWVP